MDSDKLLKEHKGLFITAGVVLAVLAIWHLTYVIEAINATGDRFLLREYGMLALGLVMLSLLTGITLLCTAYKKEVIWIIAFALLAISSMRVQPGLSAPDEPTHYISAYYWSNVLMLQEPDDEKGKVYIREEDAVLEDLNEERAEVEAGLSEGTEIFGQVLEEKTLKLVHEWDYDDKVGTTTSILQRMETNPLVYLPAALGISAARTVNAKPLTLLTMGKLFNLIAFMIMVFWAVKRTPIAKNIMMAVTLLPMTVTLASSMSYDAMLIGLSFMFIAEVLYLAYAKDKIGWKDIILPAVILAVMSPCKMVYGIEVLLLLLIPKEKYESKTINFAMWAICIVAVIGSVLAVNLSIISSYASASGNELEWAGEEGYTIAYCLRHPVEVIRMVYDSVIWQGGYWHQTMIGSYLGNCDPEADVPYFVVMILAAILLMMPLAKPNDENVISVRDKIVIAGTGVLLAGMLMGSMLIGWTPFSSSVILGVQGRYFIPILPAILILFRNKLLVFKKDISKELLFIIVCCDAYALIRLYSMIALHV